MTIGSIIEILEKVAPLPLQEAYDNAGLLTGLPDTQCTGVLCCLDATEAVVEEAIEKKCNLVVAHHPIIFSGLQKITGNNYVERVVIKAIKQDIALYALHTNLDNVIDGVNGWIARKLGLTNIRILAPKINQLEKLFFFVPPESAERIMQALFAAGGGQIGNYSECSFRTAGTGTFLPGNGAQPYSGTIGQRHEADELKIEVLYAAYLQSKLITALKANHPYEEVAFEVIALQNQHQEIGAGVTGELTEAVGEREFLQSLKSIFGLSVVKHTPFLGKPITRVSICGGAGSFLIKNAINYKSDIYISSDLKYHEFFDADGKIVIADIGHYESEQFTIDLLQNILQQKIPNFAVLKTTVNTNPVQYL